MLARETAVQALRCAGPSPPPITLAGVVAVRASRTLPLEGLVPTGPPSGPPHPLDQKSRSAILRLDRTERAASCHRNRGDNQTLTPP